MSILLSIPSYIFSLVPPLPYFSPPRPASNQQEPFLPAESDFNSFTTIFNPETLTAKGLHRVGSLEHEGDIDGEHELYYELYVQAARSRSKGKEGSSSRSFPFRFDNCSDMGRERRKWVAALVACPST
jgi:hypothetical protein